MMDGILRSFTANARDRRWVQLPLCRVFSAVQFFLQVDTHDVRRCVDVGDLHTDSGFVRKFSIYSSLTQLAQPCLRISLYPMKMPFRKKVNQICDCRVLHFLSPTSMLNAALPSSSLIAMVFVQAALLSISLLQSLARRLRDQTPGPDEIHFVQR